MSAQEVTATYDCRAYGCTNEAKTNRGPYAYLCDDHVREKVNGVARERPAAAAPRPIVPAPTAAARPAGFSASLKQLDALARNADRAQKAHERQLVKARGTKAAAEAARAEFQAALRKATEAA